MNRSIIVVAGFPKGGISLLTHCLRILGLKCVDAQAQANVATIHGLLLQELDYDPIMVGPLPQDWMQTSAGLRAKERIRHLFSSDNTMNGPMIVSDPLLCRILPLWLEVLEEESIDPCFIRFNYDL